MFWHWPDKVIGKKESRRLREEHNALANRLAYALEATDIELTDDVVSLLRRVANRCEQLSAEILPISKNATESNTWAHFSNVLNTTADSFDAMIP